MKREDNRWFCDFPIVFYGQRHSENCWRSPKANQGTDGGWTLVQPKSECNAAHCNTMPGGHLEAIISEQIGIDEDDKSTKSGIADTNAIKWKVH